MSERTYNPPGRYYPPDHFGQRVTVRNIFGGYPLPAGLPEGAEVTLESFDHGFWGVDYQGRKFQVFIACLGDSGQLPPPVRRRPNVHPGCKPRVRPTTNHLPEFPKRG